MGLDVKIFTNTKPHKCETLARVDVPEERLQYKRKLKCFSDDTYVFSKKEYIVDISLCTPVREVFKCECATDDDDANIIYMYGGLASCINVVQYPYLGPYEYEDCHDFYFGAYSKFFRLKRHVPIMKGLMSDSSGFYCGKEILEKLKDQLKQVKETDTALEEYFDLLDGKDLSRCILHHC